MRVPAFLPCFLTWNDHMVWGMKNVVLCSFGSSIMEGRIGVKDPMGRWYNLLHTRLSRERPATCFSIINSAVGGESTREIMARLDRDVLTHQPNICMFMVGGNNHDCQRPHRILAQGELQTLMERFASSIPEKTRVIGVILNPVVDDWHFATRHPDYQTHLAAFAGSLDASLNIERDMARDFYEHQNWPCLDLYRIMRHAPEKYVLREDGIHMNPAGHALFAEKMFELVNDLL